jgi:hypothetical protein
MYRFPNVFKITVTISELWGRVALSCFFICAMGMCAAAQESSSSLQLPLDNLKGLKAKKVDLKVVEYLGRKAVRVHYQPREGDFSAQFVTIDGLDFQDGVIEVDLAATGLPINSEARAPGFVGIAFRIQPDPSRYEFIYLRPANARSGDQLVRNHAAQYSAAPDFDWSVSRRQWPGVYETWADLKPGEWTKFKLVVSGRTARLYLHGSSEPTLLIDDLRNDPLRGSVGLWLGPMTEAYYSNLRITPAAPKPVLTGTDAAGEWVVKMNTDRGVFNVTLTLNLKRTGEKVEGTCSGAFGQDVPVTGTWRNGFIELKWRGSSPRGDAEVETFLAGWLEGDSGKGRIRVEGTAEGVWVSNRKR